MYKPTRGEEKDPWLGVNKMELLGHPHQGALQHDRV